MPFLNPSTVLRLLCFASLLCCTNLSAFQSDEGIAQTFVSELARVGPDAFLAVSYDHKTTYMTLISNDEIVETWKDYHYMLLQGDKQFVLLTQDGAWLQYELQSGNESVMSTGLRQLDRGAISLERESGGPALDPAGRLIPGQVYCAMPSEKLGQILLGIESAANETWSLYSLVERSGIALTLETNSLDYLDFLVAAPRSGPQTVFNQGNDPFRLLLLAKTTVDGENNCALFERKGNKLVENWSRPLGSYMHFFPNRELREAFVVRETDGGMARISRLSFNEGREEQVATFAIPGQTDEWPYFRVDAPVARNDRWLAWIGANTGSIVVRRDDDGREQTVVIAAGQIRHIRAVRGTANEFAAVDEFGDVIVYDCDGEKVTLRYSGLETETFGRR